MKYIKEHYFILDEDEEPIIEDEVTLIVPVLVKQKPKQMYIYKSLCYDFKDEEIYAYNDPSFDITDQMREYFNVSNDNYAKISPKDGKDISNAFFIEVLDYVLSLTSNDNNVTPLLKKKSINESVWSDIRKKSLGQEERKQNMNAETFYNYLLNHYKLPDLGRKFKIGLSEHGILSVPIMYDLDYERVLHNKSSIRIISSWNDCLINYITIDGQVTKTNMYQKIKDTFDLDEKTFVSAISISPKGGGELTTEFLMDLIDFFIDNVDENEKLIEKK